MDATEAEIRTYHYTQTIADNLERIADTLDRLLKISEMSL